MDLKNYTLSELLEVEKLQQFLDDLDKAYSIPSAIIDMEGNILTATAWQDICTKFHRENPDVEKLCIESDTHITKKSAESLEPVIYKCPMGLVDTITPILIDGIHMGNVFTGQLFLEYPDENDFRKKARKYGFDEDAYIEVLRKVPIVTEEKLKANLAALRNLAEMLTEQGIQKKIQQNIKKEIHESREFFRTLVEFTNGIHWGMDLATMEFTYVSPQIEKILGFKPGKWDTFESWANTLHCDDYKHAVEYCVTETKSGKDHAIIYRAISADGSIVWLHDIVKVIQEENKPVKLLGIMFDITEFKEAEIKIKDSLNEKNVLLKEIHHRVKNNMAVISSLIALQADRIDDEHFKNIFKQSQSRIKSMVIVHEILYSQDDFAKIDLYNYIGTLFASIINIMGQNNTVKLQLDIEKIKVKLNTMVPLGLIINELITNSLKHAFLNIPEPVISISIKKVDKNNIEFIFHDNGPDFDNRLDNPDSRGLGLLLIERLIGQLNGKESFSNNYNKYNKYKIIFPND